MTRPLILKRDHITRADFLTEEKPGGKYTKHTPSVNVEERKEEYVLTLAAPGFRREDFEIFVNGNAICIQPRKSSHIVARKEAKKTRCEYNFSDWKRKFFLPKNVDASFAHAFYVNGELDVHIPKNSHPLQLKYTRIEVY